MKLDRRTLAHSAQLSSPTAGSHSTGTALPWTDDGARWRHLGPRRVCVHLSTVDTHFDLNHARRTARLPCRDRKHPTGEALRRTTIVSTTRKTTQVDQLYLLVHAPSYAGFMRVQLRYHALRQSAPQRCTPPGCRLCSYHKHTSVIRYTCSVLLLLSTSPVLVVFSRPCFLGHSPALI